MTMDPVGLNGKPGARDRVRGLVVPALALLLWMGGAATAADDSATRAATTDTAAAGATTAAADKGRTAERRPSGTLVVFNRPIVTFRSTFLGIAPAERAETARMRIFALLERGGGKVTVEDAPQGSVARRCPDLRRLRTLTGYVPKISLEAGVGETFAWYRDWWPRQESPA